MRVNVKSVRSQLQPRSYETEEAGDNSTTLYRLQLLS
jgi:hypothetical protein